MSKLSPFLYYFQDPSTVFAFHLIYTHNIIHWYLLIILFFVYFTMASLLRNFTWGSFSKSRGLFRSLPWFPGVYRIQLRLFAVTFQTLTYSFNYYLRQAFFWVDALYELRDDPKSYLYLYYPRQLEILKAIFIETNVPLSILDEIALEESHPDLYLVNKLTQEEDYYTLMMCFIPPLFVETEELHMPILVDTTEERPWWLVQKNLDNYITPYFSRKYSLHSWFPQQAFLAAQRGNDSLPFEYTCVILPTLIVFIILAHSLSLLYSGSEEINPGLHFTAVGHQWFWSYELETLIHNYSLAEEEGTPTVISVKANFDSIPITENSLSFGSKRLLEVDNPLVLPVGVPLKALATSGDVLHSWAVPEMGIKIDAVPGRINDSISFIQRPGIFYGQCSELCGVGHGFMPIVVEALDVPNFVAWAERLEA